MLLASLVLNLILLIVIAVSYRLIKNHIATLTEEHSLERIENWRSGFDGGYEAGMIEGARKERLFALQQKFPSQD